MRLPVHAPGYALYGAEKINEDRHGVAPAVAPHDVLEQHRRTLLGKEPRLDLGHLQMRRDRRRDAHQLPRRFEAGNEIAQRRVGHGTF